MSNVPRTSGPLYFGIMTKVAFKTNHNIEDTGPFVVRMTNEILGHLIQICEDPGPRWTQYERFIFHLSLAVIFLL